MIGRTLFFAVALAAAMGIPYVLTSSQSLRERASQWLQGESGEARATDDVPGADIGSGARSARRARSGASDPIEKPAGPPVSDFGEIFRFDITPAWVLGRWPRVTTQLPELELQGYRVPLVTGTREDDLAGSLTYYFNREQKLQRIVFFGTTGDARRLVSFLVSRFGFERELKADPGLFLYQIKWSGKPVSELRVRPADVVSAANPHARFEVALAIERPRNIDRPRPFGLSNRSSVPDPGVGLYVPRAAAAPPAAATAREPATSGTAAAGQPVASGHGARSPVPPGAGPTVTPAGTAGGEKKGFSLWSLLPSWFSQSKSSTSAAVPVPGGAPVPQRSSALPSNPAAATAGGYPQPLPPAAGYGPGWNRNHSAPALVP